MKSALMLGVNPKAEREKNDFYATNPKAMKSALPYLEKTGLSRNVWECACGKGHLSEVLRTHGYYVKSTDLIDRGYGEVQDFLQCSGENAYDCDIVTNPPFRLAEKFVEKGMNLITKGHKVCLFLKVQFLESKNRYKLFKKYPLKKLLVYSERQQCAKDAEFEKYTATTQCYCWFVFEKGYEGEPTIDWIIDHPTEKGGESDA